MSEANAIVCGFDGRAGGRDALLLGELLARTVAGHLDVVVALPAGGELADLEAEVEAALAPSAVSYAITAHEGRAAETLMAATDEDTVTLTIGSTHRAGLGRVFPGTTASRLLGATACPVAIAPRSYGADIAEDGLAHALRVIEVGYDGSAQAAAALEHAAQLAAAAGATLRVIAVKRAASPDAQAASSAGAYAVSTPFDLQQSLHDAVGELPDELRALPIFEHGSNAASVLVERANGVDLLVVGSRGHGRVGTALLGSTSKAVTEAVSCPTVVVPRGQPGR